ncbi:Got1/Sft2-like vescicle transport protein family [Striga hermonthica]|uniref:Got1/Sft2-like vescicle transport protein family n=1 Tax=Striga hermonthica TaxID=68872 RepID=A0A9N7MU00_STRHE|nr:Got1/Sft2-like vescicle transport protein family [Striga hermonthica]
MSIRLPKTNVKGCIRPGRAERMKGRPIAVIGRPRAARKRTLKVILGRGIRLHFRNIIILGSLLLGKMPYELNEQKKIGLGLVGFGIFFFFLAIILFFDRGLLALGNIFWLAGVAILLGWRSTWQLFTNRRNYKGSVSFLLGIFFIFVRWPVVGILVEIYGCFVLFGGFWPSIKVFLYHIPVLGWILQYPVQLLNQFRRSTG